MGMRYGAERSGDCDGFFAFVILSLEGHEPDRVGHYGAHPFAVPHRVWSQST
jgi:hypothetical protein